MFDAEHARPSRVYPSGSPASDVFTPVGLVAEAARVIRVDRQRADLLDTLAADHAALETVLEHVGYLLLATVEDWVRVVEIRRAHADAKAPRGPLECAAHRIALVIDELAAKNRASRFGEEKGVNPGD